jgi:AmmeMemoRadiSam system protein A
MTDIASRITAHGPDVVVLVSPHSPRHASRWGICTQSPLSGNFGRFGADHIGVIVPGAPPAAARLTPIARELKLTTREIGGDNLDHGALVPLYFLRQAGWDGPTLLIALPQPGTKTEERMGRAIARAAEEAGESWVILASGDMSHRLNPNAPAGYHPLAKEFDRTFKSRIDAGDLRGACAIDPGLREIAAEDVIDSCAVAAGAVGFRSLGHRCYAYEGPFGVGYLEAVLHEAAPPQSGAHVYSESRPWGMMLQIARDAILARITHNAYRAPVLPKPWNNPQGVFVTLRRPDGALRGCIGHVEPLFAGVAEEVADCAAAAATQDTRFARVSPSELPQISIEVSLLSRPEPVSDMAALDPKRYGLVVSSGRARGVLLPNVPEVNTVEDQLRIAAAKGQLPPGRPWIIERFEVSKAVETPGPLTSVRGGRA